MENSSSLSDKRRREILRLIAEGLEILREKGHPAVSTAEEKLSKIVEEVKWDDN